MSEFNVEVSSGNSIRLLTAGKYCDRDIIVSSPKVEGQGGRTFVKVASDFECVRAVTTINIKAYDWWESVTVDDIYCVTKSVKSTASGTFAKNATCSVVVSYSNGIISLNRTGLDGSLVLSFIMDVYIAPPL